MNLIFLVNWAEGSSVSTVSWTIEPNTGPGFYQLIYLGDWKVRTAVPSQSGQLADARMGPQEPIRGRITPFSGRSSVFRIG